MGRIRLMARGAWACFWLRLRQASGDAAYEAYLGSAVRRARTKHAERSSSVDCAPNSPSSTPGPASEVLPVVLSRKDFYLDSLRRRYSRVCRCC